MKNELDRPTNISKLYKEISNILHTARANAYKAVNFAMVTSYWAIGRIIVEDEQNGNERAEYGKAVLEELSKKLTADFGKGFDVRELRKIRQFYLEFKNRDSLRPELTWSHYRMLLRVKDETARNWYMNEEKTSVTVNLPNNLPNKLPNKLLNNVAITYKAICDDVYATNQEIAFRANQSERTVRNHIEQLKNLNYIKRSGSKKTGHWEIIDNGVTE